MLPVPFSNKHNFYLKYVQAYNLRCSAETKNRSLKLIVTRLAFLHSIFPSVLFAAGYLAVYYRKYGMHQLTSTYLASNCDSAVC